MDKIFLYFFLYSLINLLRTLFILLRYRKKKMASWWNVSEPERKTWELNVILHGFQTIGSCGTILSREECFDWAGSMGYEKVEAINTCENSDALCFSDGDCSDGELCQYNKSLTEDRQQVAEAPPHVPPGCWEDKVRKRVMFNPNEDQQQKRTRRKPGPSVPFDRWGGSGL